MTTSFSAGLQCLYSPHSMHTRHTLISICAHVNPPRTPPPPVNTDSYEPALPPSGKALGWSQLSPWFESALRLSFLFKRCGGGGMGGGGGGGEHCLVTLSLTVNETLKWFSSLAILMPESFWWAIMIMINSDGGVLCSLCCCTLWNVTIIVS